MREINNLQETVEMMTSDNYKDRFRAEFYQLNYRWYKLRKMIHEYEEGTLPFEPKCSIELLKSQLDTMDRYLGILTERAEIEGVEL